MTSHGGPEVLKMRVLVVEDDPASRAALISLLCLTGFDAIAAGTVSEGLKLLQFGPHCVILDLMLPDGNGAVLLAHIRQNQLPISVAITTGAIEWQPLLMASPQPPDVVFSKPVSFNKLFEWLGKQKISTAMPQS